MTIERNIPLPSKPARALSGIPKQIFDLLPQCSVGDSFLVDSNLKGVRLTAGKIAARLSKTGAERYSVVVAEESTQVRVWRTSYVARTPRAKKASV